MKETIRTPEARAARGAGYCTNLNCAEFLKLRLQSSAPASYSCSACGEPGELELERGMRSGEGPVVSEVRVEYCFDAADALYRGRVSVRDPRWLRPLGVFTLQTPLISDEKAARSLGEALLRKLAASHRHLSPERRPVPRIDSGDVPSPR